jgi:hypothetical protein
VRELVTNELRELLVRLAYAFLRPRRARAIEGPRTALLRWRDAIDCNNLNAGMRVSGCASSERTSCRLAPTDARRATHVS